jgi:hypothetical protein
MDDDFSYLDEVRVDETTTRPFTFYGVLGEPVLICAPATVDNQPYMEAAALALVAIRASRMPEATDEQKRVQREQERLIQAQLLTAHCVRGWHPGSYPVARIEKVWVKDQLIVPAGTEGALEEPRMRRFAEYSSAATLKFLEQVAVRTPNVFNRFNTWISMSATFAKVSREMLEVTAGNSAGG